MRLTGHQAGPRGARIWIIAHWSLIPVDTVDWFDLSAIRLVEPHARKPLFLTRIICRVEPGSSLLFHSSIVGEIALLILAIASICVTRGCHPLWPICPH